MQDCYKKVKVWIWKWVLYWWQNQGQIFYLHKNELHNSSHFFRLQSAFAARAWECLCLSDSHMKAPTVCRSKYRPEKALFVCALFNRQASFTKWPTVCVCVCVLAKWPSLQQHLPLWLRMGAVAVWGPHWRLKEKKNGPFLSFSYQWLKLNLRSLPTTVLCPKLEPAEYYSMRGKRSRAWVELNSHTVLKAKTILVQHKFSAEVGKSFFSGLRFCSLFVCSDLVTYGLIFLYLKPVSCIISYCCYEHQDVVFDCIVLKKSLHLIFFFTQPFIFWSSSQASVLTNWQNWQKLYQLVPVKR